MVHDNLFMDDWDVVAVVSKRSFCHGKVQMSYHGVLQSKLSEVLWLNGFSLSKRKLRLELFQIIQYILIFRMEYLWQEELQKNGLREDSLSRAVSKFLRTRKNISVVMFTGGLMIGIATPVSQCKLFFNRLSHICKIYNFL